MNFTAPPFPEGEPHFVAKLKEKEQLEILSLSGTAGKDELDLRSGYRFENKFPDPDELLVTATDELLALLQSAKIMPEGKAAITLRRDFSLEDETFRMVTDGSGIILESGTLEGMRRAIYFLENELIAKGPFVKHGKIIQKCHIRNRISRCFFGPIKRPPYNIDELANNIDYYPDAYLARLARERINGLWLTVVFREICRTSFLPEDPLAKKRRTKLRETVEKCRRYGIRIWIFCIEPANWNPKNLCPFEEMKGPPILGTEETCHYFCPDSEQSQNYLYECAHSLFKDVPHLGGLITISYGERLTSCLTGMKINRETRKNACPEKCSRSVSGILSKVLAPLVKGMKDANPGAELVSWLYVPQQGPVDDWIYKLPEELSENLTIAFNFESGILKNQLGITHCGGDYWLSAVGPSERFGRMAEACRGRCLLGAKIQACSSHELSTIPYIPVPGILYRKYKAMRELGVSSVIQCWYFGNYPGCMNLAAGWLSFTGTTPENEDDFLIRLACRMWPQCPEKIAEAWKLFAESYEFFPLDIKFQYYSPVQDGPVWPLHLKQTMTSLPRTWKPDAEPAGDVIAECIQNHTLAEAAELMRKVSSGCRKAYSILENTVRNLSLSEAQQDDLSLCEAFALLMDSAKNILDFYLLRAKLFDSPANAHEVVDRLEKIVRAEIENSKRLNELCLADPRLGYHSEAEVYKYYPEKLCWRISMLEQLLATEFPEVRAGLEKGRPSLELIAKMPDMVYSTGVEYESGSIRWRLDPDGNDMILTMKCAGVPGDMNEMLGAQFCDRIGTRHPAWFQLDRWIANDSKPNFLECNSGAECSVEDSENHYTALFRIPMLNFGDPFWVSLRRERRHEGKTILELIPEGGSRDYRLEQLFFHPSHMLLVKTMNPKGKEI